jgi:Amt family ammonium transporter
MKKNNLTMLSAFALLAATAGPALAEEVPAINSGDTAWMMTSTALVLFMTLPGLALFYGGLVRRKNVLSVLAQCLGIAGLATLMWWAFGYSLSFSGEGKFIGDLGAVFFKGLYGPEGSDIAFSSKLAGVPDSVFAMFQLTFAIITPALIVGAIAERMKYTALMTFVATWSGAAASSAKPSAPSTLPAAWWYTCPPGTRPWCWPSFSARASAMAANPCLRTAWCCV